MNKRLFDRIWYEQERKTKAQATPHKEDTGDVSESSEPKTRTDKVQLSPKTV